LRTPTCRRALGLLLLDWSSVVLTLPNHSPGSLQGGIGRPQGQRHSRSEGPVELEVKKHEDRVDAALKDRIHGEMRYYNREAENERRDVVEGMWWKDRAARRLRVGRNGVEGMWWTAASQPVSARGLVRAVEQWSDAGCCRGVGVLSCPSKGRCCRAAELVQHTVSASQRL
jgi:hypothetical protein